jgi:hypothetical protein
VEEAVSLSLFVEKVLEEAGKWAVGEPREEMT